MKQARSVFPIFFIFVILTLLILSFLQQPLLAPLQSVTMPIQRWVYTTITPDAEQSLTPQESLQKENDNLKVELAKLQELKQENDALRAQFDFEKQNPKDLMPATVIGRNAQRLVLDRGEKDGLTEGDIVLVKDSIIGRIISISPRIAVVATIMDPLTSFTAEIDGTETIGVVRSDNGKIIFGNVVQSETLKEGSIVMTSGNVNAEGKGYPPGYVVGKIVSINKKESDLFQSARVESLLDFKQLRTVFIVKAVK